MGNEVTLAAGSHDEDALIAHMQTQLNTIQDDESDNEDVNGNKLMLYNQQITQSCGSIVYTVEKLQKIR